MSTRPGSLPAITNIQRFNPMAGLTYKFNPNISAYGGYAEANRAPTPAELGCANPNSALRVGGISRQRPESPAGRVENLARRLPRQFQPIRVWELELDRRHISTQRITTIS